MTNRTRYGASLRFALYGLLMGYFLSRMGFSDFAEVHAMFVFSELRLFLSFAGGVALIALSFLMLRQYDQMPSRTLNPGSAIGGVLFGVGWALSGACPSIVLVQIGEGQVAALATLVGVIAGTAVYPRLHRRFFSWNVDSCSM